MRSRTASRGRTLLRAFTPMTVHPSRKDTPCNPGLKRRDVDERERLAVLEEAVRQIHARQDRNIGELRSDLSEARDEIKESRDECATGLEKNRSAMREEFKTQRESARAWIVAAIVAVSGVATIAVGVVGLVVK